MKTERYLYTEWYDDDDITAMLFDHQSDPGENENIADRPAAADVVKRLSRLIREELLRAAQIDQRKF